MSRSSFLLGADPELFLQSNKTGRIVSAIGKIGGTKTHPLPVESLGKGFAIQEDNVLVEYNIPPADSVGAFILYNKHMMSYLSKKVNKEHDCQLAIQASHIMDDEALADPRAHVFGCEPDFNVWTLEDNPRPCAVDPALRSAGGHVHIGLKMGRMDKIVFARLLDSTLGVWSVMLDEDTRRRELYGRAGAIRLKPYGLEYRTLSNFWLQQDYYQRQVWENVTKAYLKWKARDLSVLEDFGEDIFNAINTSDRTVAEKIYNASWS
jgi:hypothetical protein